MSEKRLFVSNLSYQVGEDAVATFFNQAGFNIESVNVIKDRETGKSKGFAFVELVSEEDLEKAIQNLSGLTLDGRDVFVAKAEAKERAPRPTGGIQRRVVGDETHNCPECGAPIVIRRRR